MGRPSLGTESFSLYHSYKLYIVRYTYIVYVHVVVALLLLLLKVCFLSLHIYSGQKEEGVGEEKLTDLGLCYPNCVQIN